MTREQQINRMKELTGILRQASKAYYAQDAEIMSNYTYDTLYDELLKLEEETGTVLAGSPTVSVGYEAVDELPKEAHEAPMLSLDKTKDPEVLRDFMGTHKTLLSWKLDGLTIVLTYRDGKLFKAVTRGDGRTGEVVTNNAGVFRNVPVHIPFKGELVLRGEAVISYEDFEKINEEIEDVQAKYKNPRNLCSGSVRQLNNEITAKRNVRFIAFGLVRAEGLSFGNSHEKEFDWLAEQGFEVVEHVICTGDTLDFALASYAGRIGSYPLPSDGLVALYDDIAYGDSLGTTAKFPRNAFAFKWQDEIRSTHLLEMEWSASRTGLINPVAIFEPVELEGTTVSRASVHNVSIVKALQLGIGDELTVYKANMIIPQIADNLTRSDTLPIPSLCPVCGNPTVLHDTGDVQTLYCENPDCLAKKIKSLVLFTGRDGMNIDGLSEATLEKFLSAGILHSVTDLFHLEQHADKIISMEGFGEKSYLNLQTAIEKARHTTLPRLICSLGIPGVGAANARLLCEAFRYDFDALRNAPVDVLTDTEGIGSVTGRAIVDYFANSHHKEMLDALVPLLDWEIPEQKEERIFEGKTFVVTGSVTHFRNRNELKAFIEERGGKVTGSVSAKTDYLINNDVASSSSKNQKAAKLGIPVLSEEAFLQLADEMGGQLPTVS